MCGPDWGDGWGESWFHWRKICDIFVRWDRGGAQTWWKEHRTEVVTAFLVDFEIKCVFRAENKFEYVNLVKKTVMNQLLVPYQKIREGFYFYLYPNCVQFVDPLMLEEKLCGVNYVRKISKNAKKFNFSNFEFRQKYLKTSFLCCILLQNTLMSFLGRSGETKSGHTLQ